MRLRFPTLPALGVIVVMLLVGGVLTGMAIGQTTPDTYTGCLTKGGSIIEVAVGEEPAKPCSGSQTEISLSAGSQGVDDLRADVDALLEVIQIDPTTGAVTIASPDDLTLDSGDEAGDAVTIMDDTEIEGDAMAMQELEVMGETMLEGDTTLMEDAEVMGDATFEASVALADTTTTVDSAGLLTPLSSSVTVAGFDLGPLREIVPAAVNGTILEIHFGMSGAVLSCPPGCLGGNNIDLKASDAVFFAEVGDTLKLVSDGPTWVEVSRSSGHTEAFSVTEDVSVSRGDTVAVSLRCSDPPDGREGSLLLTASVNLGVVTDLVVVSERILVLPGDDFFDVVVENTNLLPGFPEQFEIALRCLSI